MLQTIIMSIVLLQGPHLTPADAGQITRVVAAALVPDTGSVDHRPIHGRPLILDIATTRRAFGMAASALTVERLGLDRPPTAMSRAEAIQCDSVDAYCSVANDGIYFAIDSVDRLGAKPGEFRVVVSLRWTHGHSDGRAEVQGPNVTVYVARIDSAWKLVRYGSAVTG